MTAAGWPLVVAGSGAAVVARLETGVSADVGGYTDRGDAVMATPHWILSFQKPPSEWGSMLPKQIEACMKMLGEFWYKELLPKHFTAQAGARYKFQMRTPKYMAEKLRKKATRNTSCSPATWSGW